MSAKVTIYHNPRCSKSRKALEILEAKPGIQLSIKKYLEEGITTDEAINLGKLLEMDVNKFLRTKEDEYKSLDIDWSDNEKAAKALSDFPKILERPIVIKGDRAVVARPPEDLEKLF